MPKQEESCVVVSLGMIRWANGQSRSSHSNTSQQMDKKDWHFVIFWESYKQNEKLIIPSILYRK